MLEECLRDRPTLHQSAERCGILYRTAFLWRHRFLDKGRQGTSLKGIVEMDETCFLESCKADRSLLAADSRGGPFCAATLASTAAADFAPVMSKWLVPRPQEQGRSAWRFARRL